MPQADFINKMQVSDRHVTIDILKVLKPEGGKKPHLCYTLEQNTPNVQPDAEYIKGCTTQVGRNFKRVTVLKFISR